ncbi:SPFH domain-containing protein [Parachitinimonas caeni]|uniref:SPFH domain-containing protein n=1 Tax=Parachitinimonas caeni TaxID=3031301 RepID=A0ABT7DTH9_9NEIS|nr:SPFH domain-containing protein [Parachitinimonas caeni]MDK2123360.1 SPFH domain-containing protein [Parachitinimonas caeni]
MSERKSVAEVLQSTVVATIEATQKVLTTLIEALQRLLGSMGEAVFSRVPSLLQSINRMRGRLLALGVTTVAAYALYTHPPFLTVERGEMAIRTNQLTGNSAEFGEGPLLEIPGLHSVRVYSMRDQLFRPTESRSASGNAPFQSMEGLAVGVDLSVRYALDPTKLAQVSKRLPDNVGTEIVQPVIEGIVYRTFTRYSVKEIFSTKRMEIQQSIADELKPKLAADGIVLKSVMIGQVDLPADYKAGLEKMLAAEMESDKMRYTLDLRSKQVKQNELEAEAEKVKREKAAEAAGQEQIIAARAQAEAMKHVLPFKQKQIEQRQLEAEAEKISRIKTAEASAEARRIEAAGEADSRHKLADAEVYRMEKVGKVASEQLARDGALIAKNPLLIQKTLADKLSDKISVIIAPPPADGGFIGSALLGASKPAPVTPAPTQPEEAPPAE